MVFCWAQKSNIIFLHANEETNFKKMEKCLTLKKKQKAISVVKQKFYMLNQKNKPIKFKQFISIEGHSKKINS